MPSMAMTIAMVGEDGVRGGVGVLASAIAMLSTITYDIRTDQQQ